jgi:hypothetical protein
MKFKFSINKPINFSVFGRIMAFKNATPKSVVTFSLLLSSLLTVPFQSHAQDLQQYLPKTSDTTVTSALKTFRAVRIVNTHSVELPEPGEMIFNIGHRFASLNNGLYDMFGLDDATMRLGMDFGINQWLSAGFGRSSFQKNYDLYTKSKLLSQSGNSPLTIAGYASLSAVTMKYYYPPHKDSFKDRLTYTLSILMARKFSDRFSVQLAPTWLHTNYLPENEGSVDVVTTTLASHIKLTKSIHLNAEYIHHLTNENKNFKNILSFGFDVETGGHIFQLFFSNTQGISDKAYLTHTYETWNDGAIFFGFNITRVFYFK